MLLFRLVPSDYPYIGSAGAGAHVAGLRHCGPLRSCVRLRGVHAVASERMEFWGMSCGPTSADSVGASGSGCKG